MATIGRLITMLGGHRSVVLASTATRASRSVWAFGVILLGLLFAGTTSAAAADPLEDYKLAVGLYNKGRWQLAAETFESFLKAAPDHPNAERARYYLGLTWFNGEKYENCRTVLRDFVKRYPKSQRVVEANYWSGYASFLLGDHPAAATELEAFRAASPGDPLLQRALPMLGESLLRTRKLEQAEALFAQSLKLHPEGVMAEDCRFGLARANELQGKSAEAVRLYEALANDKTSSRAAEARLNLGIRHYDDGRFAEAEAAFTRLITEFPESPSLPLAQLNLGFARYQLNQFAPAAEAFLTAAKAEKYAVEGTLWAGFSRKAQGDFAAAAAILKAGYEAHQASPSGEKFLYHWADSVQRLGDAKTAGPLYLDVVTKYPKGTLADAALLAAATLALGEKKLDEASALLTRLETEYPQSAVKDRGAILKGRIALERNDLPAAITQLTPILASPDAATQAEARYVLAVAYQRQQDFPKAVATTDPLVADLAAGKLGSELADIWLIRATSGLAIARKLPRDATDQRKQLATLVSEAADRFLATPSGKSRGGELLAAKAACLAEAGDKPNAEATLKTLRESFPKSDALDKGLFESGEAAFSAGDFAWAETLFQEVATGQMDAALRPKALVEWGWSLQRQKKSDLAAKAFGQLVSSYPNDPLFAEAQVMQGTALADAGQPVEAIAVFDEVWKAQGTSDHAYVAGLQRARLRVRQKQLAEADAAYTELTGRFAQHAEADQILDEWATANYEAEQFAKADEIFAKLVATFPQSPLADNAGLVLAESLLIGGKPAEATPKLEALAVSPQSDDTVKQRALFQLIKVATEARDWPAVTKAATRSLEAFPAGTYRSDAEFALADAAFETGDYAAAAPRLDALRPLASAGANEMAPAWLPRVWVMLAECRFQQKDYAALTALAAEFRKVLPKSPLHYQVDAVVARSLKAQAKFPEARAAFEQVIEDPNGRLTETAARAQFELAETYLLEKNHSAAIKQYLKVAIRYNYPKWQGVALYQVAACHEALQEWKDAVRTYEELINTFADHELTGKAKEKLEAARKRAAG